MLSNPSDREKLKKVVDELVNSMIRSDSERDYRNEAINDISEELDLEKKHVRQIAKARHKANFNEVQEELSEFEDLYELLYGEI
jgi:polyhydroxyalkanoate synthesis regulator phasin